MQAGKLNRQITILAASSQQNGTGELVDEWIEQLTCRAHIGSMTSREVYSLGAGFTSQVTHKVTIRYRDVQLAAGMRVAYKNRAFVIQGVQNPDEANVQLDLLCLEQTT